MCWAPRLLSARDQSTFPSSEMLTRNWGGMRSEHKIPSISACRIAILISTGHFALNPDRYPCVPIQCSAMIDMSTATVDCVTAAWNQALLCDALPTGFSSYDEKQFQGPQSWHTRARLGRRLFARGKLGLSNTPWLSWHRGPRRSSRQLGNDPELHEFSQDNTACLGHCRQGNGRSLHTRNGTYSCHACRSSFAVPKRFETVMKTSGGTSLAEGFGKILQVNPKVFGPLAPWHRIHAPCKLC